jgi:hypothetical protein
VVTSSLAGSDGDGRSGGGGDDLSARGLGDWADSGGRVGRVLSGRRGRHDS